MNEQSLWDEAVLGMNDKARYKLANYMAHDWVLTGSVSNLTILTKDNKHLIIDLDGNMWLSKECNG